METRIFSPISIGNIRRGLIIAVGVAIPFSNALTNVLMLAIILWFFLAGHCQNQFHKLFRYPIVPAALLLFAALGIGLFYTSAPLVEALSILKKYRELLYIPLFIILFNDETARRLGLNTFMLATVVILCLSYGSIYFGSGYDSNPAIFKNYITQGILVALVAYFLTIQVIAEKKWRILKLIVILLAIYHITFISPGRTGFLVLFGLIWLFLYQRYRWRGLFFGGLGLILLSVLVLSVSDSLRTRMTDIVTYLENPQQLKSDSSTVLRYGFMKNTIELIAQRPLFGYGTGSFAHEYQKLVQQRGVYPTTNPHSEFLMLTVQLGMVGLLLFCYLFYQLWKTGDLLPLYQRQMIQGLVVAMSIGCLFNSLLLDASEAHLFAYLTGLFLADSY